MVSFLCSLDNFVLKNVIVFFFWKSNFKMALIWKKVLFLTDFSHFVVTRERHKNFFSTYLTYIRVFLLTLLTFLPHQFSKNYEFIINGFSLVRFLVLILICAILEQSMNNKIVSKI